MILPLCTHITPPQFCLYMLTDGCRFAYCFLSSARVMMDDLPEKCARLPPSGELVRPGSGGS